MIKIIGYTGFARSGKDTACSYAMEWCTERAILSQRTALADPLKVCVNAIFGWGWDHAFGDLKEVETEASTTLADICDALDKLFQKHPSCKSNPYKLAFTLIRVFEQNGVEWTFDFQLHQTFYRFKMSPRKAYQVFGTEFIRHYLGEDFWCEIAEESQRKCGGILHIPDIRFENEVDWLKGRKDTLLIGVHRPSRQDIGQGHSSEAYIEEAVGRADVVIHNTSSLDDLRKAVHYSLSTLLN